MQKGLIFNEASGQRSVEVTLNLHLCSFTICFEWMLFLSIKKINRLISNFVNGNFLSFHFLSLKS